MKLIKLTQGKITKVDNEDYEELNQFNWHYVIHGYAGRRKGGRTIYLHRQLLNVPKGFEVDHIDGNPLNNRRENLRIGTHAQNISNAKLRKDNTSGYKGVIKNGSGWAARLWFNRKQINIGTYRTKEEAAKAYNQAAKVYFGEYARLNDI